MTCPHCHRNFEGAFCPRCGAVKGIVKTSTANELEVVRAAKAAAADIQETLPEGTRILVAYDASIFVDTALHEVYKTLAEPLGVELGVVARGGVAGGRVRPARRRPGLAGALAGVVLLLAAAVLIWFIFRRAS